MEAKKTTLIIDNNFDYSDHKIYFVETDLDLADVEKILAALWHDWGEVPTVEGKTTDIDWLTEPKTRTLSELLEVPSMWWDERWADECVRLLLLEPRRQLVDVVLSVAPETDRAYIAAAIARASEVKDGS